MAEFLAIKNWDEYQGDRNGAPLEGPMPWIKDYTNKEDDYEYSQLTCFQRYILDGLRRLRGADGKNPPNDPKYIARRLAIKPKESHCIPQAIRKLDSLLLVSIVESESETTKNKSKRKTKDSDKEKPVSSEASSEQQQVKAIILLPLNAGEYAVAEEDFKLWQRLYPAVDVMQELRAMAGWCHANVKKRKTKDGVKRFINSWLSKAQNNPKVAQSFREGANGQPKSEQREQRNDAKYARIEQRIAGVSPDIGTALPCGTGGNGNRDVDTRPKLLSLGRSAGSG